MSNSSSVPHQKPFIAAGAIPAPIKKRRKGATRLSCAECRRLKLRCDRGIPCGSCVKRGCGAICPDGSLTTGQGNRFVLASTQELHEKISELANRVRQLEDGLRSAHSQLSPEVHPLLTEELLRVKAPLQREPVTMRNQNAPPVKEEEPNPDIIDAFGTLSISISGRTKYYGTQANSWYFLQNENPEEDEGENPLTVLHTVLSPDILKKASALPIDSAASVTESELSPQALCWYLPPAQKALELRQTYYDHAAWMYNPISQEAFDSQIYSHFYGPDPNIQFNDPQAAHRLSLLFMVLAIGSLVDTGLPAYNLEAERYHQLARAALFSSSIFDEPTIHAVQALFLISFYMFLADRHGTSSGARWAIMGIAIKVGQSIGLHRDSGRWKVESSETQHRRELFWELFTYDSWQCLTFGRPPSFSLAHVDSKLPFLNDSSDDKSYYTWKHRFTSECMNHFHDQAFGAKMPTYATILQLDRKMRAFPVPPVLQVAGFGSSEPRPGGFPETVMLTLQRHIVLAIREMNLLYLHRSFFARAISDHPKDPLGSPYGTSVIAAYRSAGSLVALMRNLHSQLKELKKARYSLEEYRKGRGSPMSKYGLSPTEPNSPTNDDDELSILGGKTRLVAKKEPSSPTLIDRSPVSQKPVVPINIGRQVHPSILEYLDSFNPKEPQPNYGSSLHRHDSADSSGHSAYPDDLSPVSVYGMSTVLVSPTFQTEPGPYSAHSQPYSQHSPTHHSPQHTHHHNIMTGNMHQGTSTHTIPQYFPVYDYNTNVMNAGGHVNGVNGYGDTPMLDAHPVPPNQRRSSGSPEGNMQSTWNDFVADFAM
ncbi:hypothetical protein C0993_010694 [Termitomyces sp. T159_Od127]|nr:hypothetical protein C0993_010694 [Termitomyces sp. T159_Od127]